MVKKMTNRIKILPLFLVLATGILIFKATNLITGVNTFIQPATAQEEPQQDETPVQVASPTPESITSSNINTDPLKMSRSELDLLQDLAFRRNALDDRSRQLDIRERLLEATEKRIDGKIVQLEDLETRIQVVVATYETNENEQMTRLVKVYETMKPKDAARVLEMLDDSILLDVANRMKEAKMAPILAAMDQEKARDLTTMLATRVKLPTIDG